MGKKSLWKKLFLPGFIIFIMMMSGVGYMFGRDSGEGVKYNDYKFTKTQKGWLTYKDNKQIILLNNPTELFNISVDYVDFNELNSAEKIYISSNPKDNIGGYLQGLQFNFINNLTPKIVSACYEDNEGCENFPLKDCSDASSDVKVILIKRGETKIEYKDHCLIIQGEDTELIKYIDKLILVMFLDEN